MYENPILENMAWGIRCDQVIFENLVQLDFGEAYLNEADEGEKESFGDKVKYVISQVVEKIKELWERLKEAISKFIDKIKNNHQKVDDKMGKLFKQYGPLDYSKIKDYDLEVNVPNYFDIKSYTHFYNNFIDRLKNTESVMSDDVDYDEYIKKDNFKLVTKAVSELSHDEISKINDFVENGGKYVSDIIDYCEKCKKIADKKQKDVIDNLNKEDILTQNEVDDMVKNISKLYQSILKLLDHYRVQYQKRYAAACSVYAAIIKYPIKKEQDKLKAAAEEVEQQKSTHTNEYAFFVGKTVDLFLEECFEL